MEEGPSVKTFREPDSGQITAFVNSANEEIDANSSTVTRRPPHTPGLEVEGRRPELRTGQRKGPCCSCPRHVLLLKGSPRFQFLLSGGGGHLGEG